MFVTYVRGKITAPQLPDSFIASGRLSALASAVGGKKAVFVTAPSGYGKTTFMIYALSLARDISKRVCWFHLDESDTDLELFYANLIEALFPSEESQWKSIRATLQQFSDYPTQYRYINAAICQELWTDREYHKTYLVFDDYQTVMACSEIAETVAYFIDNFPPTVAVLIGSRERPSIQAGRYSLNRTSMEIGPDELCFSEEEIAEFFKSLYQADIDKSIIECVYQKTGGWKAACIMLSQLFTTHNPSEMRLILENPLQGTGLFDYIATEVLKNADSKLIDFLMRTSILKDFTANEAKEVLHLDNARYFIAVCEKRGLFIQKINRNGGTYSFHALFREVLTILLRENIPDGEILELHATAAEMYKRKKEYSKAVEHYILSGNTDAVISLIESESVNFLLMEVYNQLRDWFSQLPDDIVERYPNLLFIKGYINLRVQTKPSLELIEKASAKYEESDNYDMQLKLLVTFVNLCTSAYERFDKALDYAQQALRILRKMEHSPEREAYRQFFIFLISVCHEKYRRALELSAHLRQGELMNELLWELLMISSDVACTLGDFNLAESLIKDALENPLSKRVDMYRGFALTIYSTALCMKNENSADLVGTELDNLGIKTDVAYFSGFTTRSAAFRHYGAGHVKSALTLLDKSIASFVSEETPVLEINARLCLLLWSFGEDSDHEKIYREASTLLDRVSGLHPGSCFCEICQSLFGAIARECGKIREAEEMLVNSSVSSKKKGAKHILCGTLMHLTRLYLDKGVPEKAELVLLEAMSIASSENYTIFWDIHLGTMNRVLVYCIKHGIYAGHAEKMLNQYFGDEAAVYAVKRLSSVRPDQVKDFSDKLYLRYSAAESYGESSHIQVNLFGGFEVNVNGTVIPVGRWKTKKVKGLFQYLVYHKGSIISREHLMELFWPDAGRKNAAMSLNTALYDLKKILKDYGLATDSVTGFIKENSVGLFINPSHHLTLDIDAFRRDYSDLKKLKKTHTDKSQIKKILEQMVELYSDGLLNDADWLLGEEEEFDQIFVEISEMLALLHAEDHEFIQAETLLVKALEIDPYNEKLCLNVLNLFVLSGARTRAITYYQAFEKRLIEELNVMPGYRLQEFIKGVRSNAQPDMLHLYR